MRWLIEIVARALDALMAVTEAIFDRMDDLEERRNERKRNR